MVKNFLIEKHFLNQRVWVWIKNSTDNVHVDGKLIGIDDKGIVLTETNIPDHLPIVDPLFISYGAIESIAAIKQTTGGEEDD